MQKKLTTTTVKALEPGVKPFEVVDSEIKGFLLRVQPSGAKTYYYSYRTSTGKRKRIKLGAHGAVTVAMARDAARKAAGEVAQGVDVQGEKVATLVQAKAARQRTLKAFLEDQYAPWLTTHQKSGQATLDRLRSAFEDFMALPMEEITVKRLDQWRTKQLKRGLKPSTINRSVNCLRGLLTRAKEWGVLTEHPLSGLKPLRVDRAPKVRFLSPEEEERLDAALDARDARLKAARESGNKHRAARGYPLLPDLAECAFADRMTPLIRVSRKTGLRRGELFDLIRADIDLEARILTVDGERTKSGHTRHIPLSPIAYQTLKDWLGQIPDESQRVFPADDGGRLDNVRKSWASILADAKIESFRWHDMRHDFASKLVMNGVPLNTVRDLCGHADSNTTLRYAHLAPSHKADAVGVLG